MTVETFAPVGVCVYCGATQERLTDEHIIPLSLNGKLVLPKASCSACAKVTGRIEEIVTRNMYGTLRLKKNFRSRHKKKRPTAMPFTGTTDASGVETTANLPLSLVPTTYVAL